MAPYMRQLVLAHILEYGHCIDLLGWIKSAAPSPQGLNCNPSPKGVILSNFFCVFVPKNNGKWDKS